MNLVVSLFTKKPFEGVIANMERRYKETDSQWIKEELERFQSEAPCEACAGYRLKPEALSVKIGGKHIGEICDLSVKAADRWFAGLDAHLNAKQQEVILQTSRWVDEQWPKWRDEFAAEEEKIQKEGGVQVVNLGPELRERANDAFWNELLAASPQNITHLMKLMRKK
mgnify:CR=1 FL=1